MTHTHVSGFVFEGRGMMDDDSRLTEKPPRREPSPSATEVVGKLLIQRTSFFVSRLTPKFFFSSPQLYFFSVLLLLLCCCSSQFFFFSVLLSSSSSLFFFSLSSSSSESKFYFLFNCPDSLCKRRARLGSVAWGKSSSRLASS